jgi:hypothetical protein
VSSSISLSSTCPFEKNGGIQEFSLTGIVVFTFIHAVSSVITLGVISTVNVFTPAPLISLSATANPSDTFAPGTIMDRAAS